MTAQAQVETKPETTDSLLGMSDDEFAGLDLSTFDSETSVTEDSDNDTVEAESQEGEALQETGEQDEQDDQEQTDEEASAESEEDEEEADDEEDEDDSSESESDEETAQQEDEIDPEKEQEKSEQEDKTESSDVDYKAFYEQITAPFRANNKEIQITNVDDAIKLMQMGAGYNKKMAALKPNLKLMRLLDNNGLLDENKLSFLIDLDKKNPEAITKLIKDAGIDPVEIDVEKQSDYQPETYTVDDRELALDDVLTDIKGSPSYNKIVDLVTTKWDGPSKQTITNHPQLLAVINDHMASGVYDLISNEMEKERMLGRLDGLSDLEAYRQVGDAIEKRRGFDHLFSAKQEQNQTPAKTVVTPKPKAKTDQVVKSKKRAASSTKSTQGKSDKDVVNPLAMSDEDYLNVGIDKFL